MCTKLGLTLKILRITSFVDHFVYKPFFVYQCMFKHEIYNLQNWNHSPQLKIYYYTSMCQLEFATVAMIR